MLDATDDSGKLVQPTKRPPRSSANKDYVGAEEDVIDNS